MIYDIAIIGAGCSGLSLAFQIARSNLNLRVLLLDQKNSFTKDRTWSFWKTYPHDFEDCVEKQWLKSVVKDKSVSNQITHKQYPYQTIDSLKFYNKILKEIRSNSSFEINLSSVVNNISKEQGHFTINTSKGNYLSKKIFDSRNPEIELGKTYQHFYGLEIETHEDLFNDEIVDLMDFNCEQKNKVHFFYILPFNKRRALVETTWLSPLTELNKKQYETELKEYLKNRFNLNDQFKVLREEIGAIPLFNKKHNIEENYFYLGLKANIQRMSTGYAFPYIQEHSKEIVRSLENNQKIPNGVISNKYKKLDEVFLKVLKKYPEKMPEIFTNMFDPSMSDSLIRFLSSKGSLYDDIKVILKMPKMIFIKNTF